MFKKMQFDLGDHYSIHTVKEINDIAVTVYKDHMPVGKARLTTDNIDVSCITSTIIDDNHVNYKFNNKYTLGDVLIKFLIKFPTVARKPEFRFILDVPENLKSIVLKHHFDHGHGSAVEKEILIRKTSVLPEYTYPENVVIERSINMNKLTDLLFLLKKNAYWQTHLTIDRLNLLVENAQCFFAWSKAGELIGFARVVTNNVSFASLWDVVVDENYRKHGIGTALMTMVFSDNILSKITNWVLYTDTAKKFYEKFGFVSECEISDRKLVHKLRLQESHPIYMAELIQTAKFGQPIYLNAKQSFQYLFSESGKRAKLSNFWKDILQVESKEYSLDKDKDLKII